MDCLLSRIKLCQSLFSTVHDKIKTPYIHVSLRPPPFQSISGTGDWESGEINEFLWAMEQPLPNQQHPSALPPLFVDIGANVGWFTINMAARGYDVAAFEGVDE